MLGRLVGLILVCSTILSLASFILRVTLRPLRLCVVLRFGPERFAKNPVIKEHIEISRASHLNPHNAWHRRESHSNLLPICRGARFRRFATLKTNR